MKKRVTVLETKRTENEHLKRDYIKGEISDLPVDIQLYRCEFCLRVMKSKPGYVNHLTFHDRNSGGNPSVLPSRPAEMVCVICHMGLWDSPRFKATYLCP